MSTRQAITRNTLFWLLVVQLLVILPYLLYLPLWLGLLWFVCTAWRWRIFHMRAAHPGQGVKAGLIVLIGTAVYATRGTLIGLDAGAVLLVAAFLLKTLEMKTLRDALVVIFLGFFTVVVSYLFDSGIWAALYSLLPIPALLACLIGLYQHEVNDYRVALRLASRLLLQALPLMLVMFVFFPRLAPFWGLPQVTEHAMTGLADSMSPGEMVALGQSSELAFRVSFEGPIPPREQLYWRAITFESFNGQRWSRSSSSYQRQAPSWQISGPSYRYEVIMQPSGQPWLYALDVPQVQANIGQLFGDFHLEHTRPIDKPFMYVATSWPLAQRDSAALPTSLSRALQLPEGNPRSRAWATQLQNSEPDPRRLVQQVLQHFAQQPFHYTLEPLPVGHEIVDDFLFKTRSGFCIHYAGAMTFVLRAAGIPARVVGGYQGGEENQAGHYLTIRQLDAHAWVEYWLAGQGWISVDPTAQVAPERIRLGRAQALSQIEAASNADSALGTARGWLNQLSLLADRLDYGWQRWVLNYQTDEQKRLFQRWFSQFSVDWRELGITLVVIVVAWMATLAFWVLKPWRQAVDPVQRLRQRYEHLLMVQGQTRYAGEGLHSFALRVAQVWPAQAQAIKRFAELYEQHQYAGANVSFRDLQRALISLRKAFGLKF